MESFIQKVWVEHAKTKRFASDREVESWLKGVFVILFPEFSDQEKCSKDALIDAWFLSQKELFSLMKLEMDSCARDSAQVFFQGLPELYDALKADAKAIEIGDPAAKDISQVIRSYPGFYAIAVYRLAHRLFVQGFPLTARLLTEHAHSKTGIDIHPGAAIGNRFFIDHGTGVVIGETTVIGDDVKLYQGVTLGALSVKKELANVKRHPTIEDGVVIYAGATILGGETIVGSHSVIGGNVWLTSSVPPGSLVQHQPQLSIVKK